MRTLLLLALLCPFLGGCQPLSLSGQVVSETGAPLPAASVEITGNEIPPSSVPDGARADATGHFTLTGLQMGDTLLVAAPGYIPQQVVYSPSMVRYPRLTVTLKPEVPRGRLDSVGAVMPACTTGPLLNTTVRTLSLPAAEPLVVLNFVAISCKSCVKDYARLSALQAAYSGRVRLLLVTAEDSARVGVFLRTHRAARDLALPIAVSDSVLGAWFPHRFLSHTVWVYKGVVRAITDPEYLTAANVDFVLKGGVPCWPVKADGVKGGTTSLLSPAGNSGPAAWYTAFSAHRGGVPAGATEGEEPSTASVKTTILNRTILQLYRYAYGLPPDIGVSHIVLPRGDSGRFISDASGYKLQWEADHTFCYESLLPARMDSATRRRKLARDLDFYFGLLSSYQKTRLPGYALVKKGKALKPLGTKMETGLISLSNLLYYLNHQWWGRPVKDASGITGRRFIPFNREAATSPGRLNRYLVPYGLALQPATTEAEALLLSENEKPSARP